MTVHGLNENGGISQRTAALSGPTSARPANASVGQLYYDTTTGGNFVWDGTKWSALAVATAPTAPTAGALTPTLNIANGSAPTFQLAFTPAATNGAPITGYVYSTDGGSTTTAATGSSSPLTLPTQSNGSSFVAGSSYSVLLYAQNAAGTSVASNSTGPTQAITLTNAPTIGTLTAVANIANGSAPQYTITFTAPSNTGSSAVTSYKYSTDGGTTLGNATGTSSPITLTAQGSGTNFVPGTSYTVILYAVNADGTSLGSSASSSVLAMTVPGAPTIGTASMAFGASNTATVTVPFTAPASNGGSTITTYTAYSSSGGYTGTLSQAGSGSIVISNVAYGTALTWTVKATNADGQGLASAASNSLPMTAPVAGGTVTSDATYFYQTFTGSGTLTVSGLTLTADVLTVAGGGGGGQTGNNEGAGGGAGGVILASSQSLTAGAYTVTVGGGGGAAGNGSNSQFGALTACIGGGYGGNNVGGVGGNGGSGGGAVGGNTAGTGTSGQGNNGATSNTGRSGGGGGGKGAAGVAGWNVNYSGFGGAGGAGSNLASTWGPVSGNGYSGYVGGGGGGAAWAAAGGGGSGGGGAGNGTNPGGAYTGGGGGGGYNPNPGGNGGSGLVVVRYTRSQVGG